MAEELECCGGPYAGRCLKPVKYIRHTQFAGSHPFCKDHAELEEGFLEDDSYEFWEQILEQIDDQQT